jgi:type II secretory pathway pseudopilin PulG
MRHKKADLSLSINAIVILILAITMLGLGLAFMRNIFGKATEEFQEVGGTVKKQMIDQMKESDKIVELSRPKIELKAGETTQIFMGFKNEGGSTTSAKYFLINSTSSRIPTSLGGKDFCNLTYTTNQKYQVYLEFKNSPTTVQSGEVVVLPINVKSTSDAYPDTCFYELEVLYSDSVATISSNKKIVELTVDIQG